MKLAVIASHPVQYQTPLFQRLAETEGVELTVFYAFLPDARVQGKGFGVEFQWDVPLLEGYSHRVFAQELAHGAGVFSLAKAFYRLGKELKGFDVILCTGWHHPALFAGIAAALVSGKPRLLRCEANNLRQRSLPARLFHHGMLSIYQAVLPIGTANARYYRTFGVPAERGFRSPYFIENRRFAESAEKANRKALRERWGIPPEAFCFLFSGKLVEKKHPVAVVEALAGIPGVHLLIVGAGELQERIRSAASEFGVGCSFAGFLNQREMPSAYAAADCLVLPSDAGETWGLVVNEAMACGLPAVVSDLVGCREDLIVEGETGFSFSGGNRGALKLCLERMATNPEQSRSMGANARRKVEACSVENAAKGVVEAAIFALTGKRESCRKEALVGKFDGKRFLLLGPTFGDEPGGIQTFTRDISRSLAGLVGAENLMAVSYRGSVPRVVEFADWVDVGHAKFRGAAFLLEAFRLCAKWRPVGIVSTFPGFSPVGAFCSLWFGIPYLTAAHGIEVWSRLPFFKRLGLGQAERVLAVSRFTARRLTSVNGVSPERVRIFPNTVDLEKFTPGPKSEALLRRLEIPRGVPVLLTVSRLDAGERAKGFFQIWDVLSADEAFREAVHLIVGGGNDLENLRGEAERRGMGERVRFAGSVPPESLAEHYRLADVFVMPSTKEGFGIVFLEALACGVPVVAADAGGAPGALLDGKLGWLADPRFPDSLAACIRAALARSLEEPRCNPVFLRSAVKTHFGPAAFSERLEAVLEELFQ